jgi:hypothetical protein
MKKCSTERFFVYAREVSGFLWLYVKHRLSWNAAWWMECVTVFALVSALGVLNELFELATVELGVARLSGADTWWDLLANTLGAGLYWVGYRMAVTYRR